MKTVYLFWITIFALVLAGCSPIIGQGQVGITSTSTGLSKDQSVGQTFFSHQGGLAGFDVYLAPSQAGSGKIILHLYSDVQSSEDLAAASLPVSQIKNPGFYRFGFSPQANSYLTNFYFVMSIEGDGEVLAGTASGDTYLDGTLYMSGQPVDGQLAFQPIYGLRQLSLALLKQGFTWLGELILAMLLFIIPGWALLSGLWPGWENLSSGEKFGLAAGASVVCYPILFLWTNLIGLHLGAFYAWLPVIAGVIFILWKNRGLFLRAKNTIKNKVRLNALIHIDPFILFPDLALVLVVGLIILVRLWVIRTLAIPMWGDSYQHTMMAQLLVDNRGLFNSWQPYTDLQSFTYHFGFHAAAAVYHWLSGLDVPTAVLQAGQWLNLLAVLALYPLVFRMTRRRWAGTFAVLIAGLLLSIPMVYVNWGRYTQLAGQVVLPAAICLAWMALERQDFDWRSLVIAGLIMGGLALTHYRILIFAICFFPAWFALSLNKKTWRDAITRLATMSAIGFIIFLPWFVHVFGGRLAAQFTQQLTTLPQNTTAFAQEYNALGSSINILPTIVWLLLVLSAAWGFWQRKKSIAVFCLWWFLVVLAVNPQWLGLPGQGALTNFALVIASYIPASILISIAAAELVGLAPMKSRIWAGVLILILVLAMGLWGGKQRLNDLAISQGTLVTRPDLTAMDWIQTNTPADSRFLVNSFFAYGGSSVVGSDAGWWLPLLGHRQSSLPPLTYVSEQGPRPDYIQWVNNLTSSLQENGLGTPESLVLLKEYGIDYLYIGQRQGSVNYSGPQVMDPQKLAGDPDFKLVYHQDRVWIFKVAK